MKKTLLELKILKGNEKNSSSIIQSKLNEFAELNINHKNVKQDLKNKEDPKVRFTEDNHNLKEIRTKIGKK